MRAKLREDLVRPNEYAPEAVCILRVIRCIFVILLEGNWSLNLNRHGPDLHPYSQFVEGAHDLSIEFSHRPRNEGNSSGSAVPEFNNQLMIDEIKIDLERSIIVRHWRGSQSSRRHVQRYIPPMIDEWRLRQPNLAHNLCPHMEGRVSVLPFFKR